jgi:hypothetical protein
MIRVVPDTIPADVYRYLLPSERNVITVRRHPVVLAPAACLLAANVTALALSAADVIPGGTGVLALCGALLPLSCYLVYHSIRAWLRACIVVTGARIMLINLRWKHPLIVIPLADAYDMTYVRTLIPGRIAGYASFLIKQSGPRRRPRKIRYLPYPEQLYLEVSGLLFPADRDSRATRSPSAERRLSARRRLSSASAISGPRPPLLGQMRF